MFQRFQNYIQNFSRMHIAESPRLKSIFAIWGSGECVNFFARAIDHSVLFSFKAAALHSIILLTHSLSHSLTHSLAALLSNYFNFDLGL